MNCQHHIPGLTIKKIEGKAIKAICANCDQIIIKDYNGGNYL